MSRPSITWITTDNHFYHDAIMEYCDREKGYEDLIIKNLKRVVAPQDTLINLGDVIFYDCTRLKGILEQIPCRHILVRGNHDKKSDNWFLNQGYSAVCEMIVVKGVLLSHHPVWDEHLPKDIKMSVCGHLHQHFSKGEELQVINGIPRYTMSLEHHNYQPINLNSLISKYTK